MLKVILHEPACLFSTSHFLTLEYHFLEVPTWCYHTYYALIELPHRDVLIIIMACWGQMKVHLLLGILTYIPIRRRGSHEDIPDNTRFINRKVWLVRNSAYDAACVHCLIRFWRPLQKERCLIILVNMWKVRETGGQLTHRLRWNVFLLQPYQPLRYRYYLQLSRGWMTDLFLILRKNSFHKTSQIILSLP